MFLRLRDLNMLLPLRFDDHIRPVNLLHIHMLDFDVILGMDWQYLDFSRVQGFLGFVMDTSLKSPNIENHSVVREFADVFPDELPGLPPAREIEFGIELISVLNLSQGSVRFGTC
ncbi:hypothetical protein Tco_1508339 [Tanacetum coccineum]